MRISLFGSVVRDIYRFCLPHSVATTLEARPAHERTIFIADRWMGLDEPHSGRITPVFSDSGRLNFQGPRWNFFVADRGITLGDVLLLKIHYHNPIFINITVLRSDPQANRPLVPPLPRQPQPHHHRHLHHHQQQQRPFLCVKILTMVDVSQFCPQLLMPSEIAEAVVELGDLDNNGDFVVRVRDQPYQHIRMETRLRLRADGELLFGENWPEFVAERGLRGEDVLVFWVDLGRRIITTTVYRAEERHPFIPFPPPS